MWLQVSADCCTNEKAARRRSFCSYLEHLTLPYRLHTVRHIGHRNSRLLYAPHLCLLQPCYHAVKKVNCYLGNRTSECMSEPSVRAAGVVALTFLHCSLTGVRIQLRTQVGPWLRVGLKVRIKLPFLFRQLSCLWKQLEAMVRDRV